MVCQQLFSKVLTFLIPPGTERRRRDLNPRAAINDLHPFQGCPFSLLGTSPNSLTVKSIFCYNPDSRIQSGEDGIRTHAPVKTNGFQDRPVMTASVPLQLFALFSARFILSLFLFNVNTFFNFFQFSANYCKLCVLQRPYLQVLLFLY